MEKQWRHNGYLPYFTLSIKVVHPPKLLYLPKQISGYAPVWHSLIHSSVLSCFKSCLLSRSFRINLSNSLRATMIYIVQPHLYADDAQTYGSVHKSHVTNCIVMWPTRCGLTDSNWTLQRLSSCVARQPTVSIKYLPTRFLSALFRVWLLNSTTLIKSILIKV